MQQILALIVLALGQQSVSVAQAFIDKNFALIDDFKKTERSFQSDTFNLINQSTEGGELIAYNSKNKDYLVFDIWLFGETGKIHATYWTDKNLNFKIIKRTDFKYDKPFYEKEYRVTETTDYLSYSDDSVRHYNADKKELRDSTTKESKIKNESFFSEVTKELKIVK